MERPFLKSSQIIESIHYQKMKFQTNHGIEVIRRDQREARSCYAVVARKTFCISIGELEACNNENSRNQMTETGEPVKVDMCEATLALPKDQESQLLEIDAKT